MAGKSVIMINFLLLWFTYGLAEEPPIAQPGNCKAQCGDVKEFHTPLEWTLPIVTWMTGSKSFAIELEPS